MATILVVEDDVALCNLLRTHLEADGYKVLQAFDGLTALTLVEQKQPHLIILDWMLPGMDGLAVCRRVRQDYLTPIIMLTARTEEVDTILGLEVGADDYISKPFSIRQVLARVRAMLRRVQLDSQGATTTLYLQLPLLMEPRSRPWRMFHLHLYEDHCIFISRNGRCGSMGKRSS